LMYRLIMVFILFLLMYSMHRVGLVIELLSRKLVCFG